MADLRRLFAYLGPYWKKMVVATVALIAGSLLMLALPWAISLLVDSVFAAEDMQLLNLIAVGLLAIFVVQSLLLYVQTYLLTYVGQRVVADLRLEIHDHLLEQPLRFFDEHRVGEMVSRVSNDVTTVQAALTDAPTSFLRQIITFVGGIGLMIYMNWQLTLIILVLIPPLILIGMLFGRRLERLSTQVQDRLAESTTVLEETLSGIRVIKAFGSEVFEQGRYSDRIEATFNTAMGRTRVRSIFIPLITFASLSAVTAVLWFGGRQVIEGVLTPGELVAFLFYMFMVAGPLGEFAGLYAQIRESLGASRRLFEILDAHAEILVDASLPDLPPIQGQVAFRNITFGYDRDTLILRDINLTARAGEVVALVGPSGVGKTTLANLIPRFYDALDGCITIDGVDTHSVQLRSLRDQIGLVPQDTFLFGGTVRENIAYGRNDAGEQAIVQAAVAAFAHEFISALPHGYDTIVGERGVKLSTGQRQRIAIARALLRDPRILILDEATSALDIESERLVQAALDRLMQGRTSFVIAHRLSTVQRADHIVVLQAGRIVEEGRHADLLAQRGLYQRLWSLQFNAPAEASIAPLLA